jgi:hypothetical protein
VVNPPNEIWEKVWNAVAEVSDESGEDDLGRGYLLKYEGWGGFCVESVWGEVEAAQKRKGMDIYSGKAKDERENACYQYAEEQSYDIIETEWIPESKEREYIFVDGGYDEGGLYGRTWALFKKN